MASSEAKSAQVVDMGWWKRNHTVIDHLRTLLAAAESGAVTGIIAAAQYADGDVAYVGGGSMCEDPMSGVAATQQLANKLLARQ